MFKKKEPDELKELEKLRKLYSGLDKHERQARLSQFIGRFTNRELAYIFAVSDKTIHYDLKQIFNQTKTLTQKEILLMQDKNLSRIAVSRLIDMAEGRNEKISIAAIKTLQEERKMLIQVPFRLGFVGSINDDIIVMPTTQRAREPLTKKEMAERLEEAT